MFEICNRNCNKISFFHHQVEEGKSFYLVFVNSLSTVAEVVCRSHEIVIFSYVDCVELSASKANDDCVRMHGATASGTQKDTIEAFNVLTEDLVVFVSAMQQASSFTPLLFVCGVFSFELLTSCLKMGVQQTTPEATKGLLTYYANTINFHNNGLAGSLNDLLKHKNDPTRGAVLTTVETLQEVPTS